MGKLSDCSKNKILHLIHLTNQHWINQSFPCICGSIPQEKWLKTKNWNFFWYFCRYLDKFNFFALGNIIPFLKTWWKKKLYLHRFSTFLYLQWKLTLWNLPKLPIVPHRSNAPLGVNSLDSKCVIDNDLKPMNHLN
jgi:hypothetical protein